MDEEAFKRYCQVVVERLAKAGIGKRYVLEIMGKHAEYLGERYQVVVFGLYEDA